MDSSSLLIISKPKYKLSVITCSLNDFLGLSRTLKSLKGLIGNDVEHILVLSNYDSESLEQIQAVTEREFCTLVQVPQQGIYAAMNIGLNVANAKLCIFINGGDEISDQKSLIDFCFGNINSVWGYSPIYIAEPKTDKKKLYKFSPYSHLLHRLGIKYIPHPGTFYQTDILKSLGGFDTTFKVAADQEISFRLSKISLPVIGMNPYAIFYKGGMSDRKESAINLDFRAISLKNTGYLLQNKYFDFLVWKVLGIARTLLIKFYRLH